MWYPKNSLTRISGWQRYRRKGFTPRSRWRHMRQIHDLMFDGFEISVEPATLSLAMSASQTHMSAPSQPPSESASWRLSG